MGGAMTIPEGKRAAAGLSANAIKWIAIAAMLADHIAYLFLPEASLGGIVLHFFGKLTAPVMCFFIAEGYFYTRSVKRYALRLALFAAVSQLPYQLLVWKGELRFFPPVLNMMFTLLCGLLSLLAWERIQEEQKRRLALLGLCLATLLADWQFFGVLFVAAFGILRGDRRRQLWAYAALAASRLVYFAAGTLLSGDWYAMVFIREPGMLMPSLWAMLLSRAGMFLAVPLLLCYNGKRTGKGTIPARTADQTPRDAAMRGAMNKWLFYLFYPIHMLVLVFIFLSLA